jgi:proteasome accessory factor B
MITKLQRWIDLVAALLTRHGAVTLEELRDLVPAYGKSGSKTALRRMFERDKDELRALGVPIEVQPLEDTTGYRLKPVEFYLPYLATVVDGKKRAPRHIDRDGYKALQTLDFDPDEVAALRAAWERLRTLGQAELFADGERGLRKLALDLPELDAEERGERRRLPREGGDSFAPLMDALSHRRRVTFEYHAIGGDTHTTRTVRPYGLFFLSAHWYLAAVEEEDASGRVKNFRVSRIAKVTTAGTSQMKAHYTIPTSFSLADHARDRKPWELGDTEAITVEVAFTGSDGATLAAARLGAEVPKHPDRRRFSVRRQDAFVRWLLSFAGEARPLSPPPVVEAWRAELAAVAAIYPEGHDG